MIAGLVIYDFSSVFFVPFVLFVVNICLND